MQLWRLSGAGYADRLDGGYGLENDGRWNTRGRPVTYCSTGPALCLLEKLVHIDDVALIPDDTMLVRYDVPDDFGIENLRLADLPDDWRLNEGVTRAIGDTWLDGISSAFLRVPSVIVPVADSADRNVLVNHRHEDAGRITVAGIEPFACDPRLFSFG